MSTKTYDELTQATVPLDGTEVFGINQAGYTKKIALNETGFMISYAITDDTDASRNGRYICDTSSNTITLTLPSTPVIGYVIELVDAQGTWATNNVIVDNNGNNINGALQTLICDVDSIHTTLVYVSDTYGWSVNIRATSLNAVDDGIANLKAVTLSSSNYDVVAGDIGKTLIITDTATCTFPIDVTGFTEGFQATVWNQSITATDVTLVNVTNAAGTILTPNKAATILLHGSTWYGVGGLS